MITLTPPRILPAPVKPFSVLIADDHEFVRAGVRAWIERSTEFDLCGEAANGREAVQLAAELAPAIVVMDLGMPELNGFDAARQIKRALLKTEILMLTANASEEVIRGVFKAGARSYLLKTETAAHLLPALTALSRHRTYFSSQVSEIVFAGCLAGKDGSSGSMLTPREREIVTLIAAGQTNKVIGATLHISIKTVETHRASLMRKLKADSVAEIVKYALRNGLAQL